MMGITIQYRGTIDDVTCVEEMEDRVLDLVLAVGGRATLWRSYADHDASRVVRGMMVEMTPGQETFSLLVSPEGHLTPLLQIEEAEQHAFAEPPSCFVKTQFGSITGHVALVHLLDALKERYIGNLEVSDEGEYYETRDFRSLQQKKEFLDGAIRSMADGLHEHGLSEEALEDPDIVAKRIERVAMLVQQKMQASDSGFTDVVEPAADDTFDTTLEEEVEMMDNIRRKNDLRGERMWRRISEASAAGMSTDEAYRLAMSEEGFGSEPGDDSEYDDSEYDDSDAFVEADEPNEPWQESLPENPLDESAKQAARERHPVVMQAQAFWMGLMDLDTHDSGETSFVRIACQGAGDMLGGLAQATGDEFDSRIGRALAITQLKRALKGHAFARGAVFGLRSADDIDKQTSDELHAQLESLLEVIHDLIATAWGE